MKSLGMVGTIYVVANMIDGGWMCNSGQIKEMVAAGWEIGSKGMTGVKLEKNYTVLGVEIAGSKAKIKEKIGVEPMSFSYPYGYNDEMIGSRVPEWGYTSGVGVFDSNLHTMNTIFYLARHDVKKSMKITDFAAMLPWAPEIMPAAPTAAVTSASQGTPAAGSSKNPAAATQQP
jgi:peptidoglycan/xylan/chitin deacetylase (PgdA/CDA1 family)